MGKYFKYAIGEILLVVIGILIAVQLNNWNESRVKHAELEQLLVDLEDFLDVQTQMMSRDISITKKAKSVLNIILSDSLNEDQIKNLPSLNDILFNPTKIPFQEKAKFEIDFSNIDNLINRKEDFPKQLWPLIYDLESLKLFAQQIYHYSKSASEASKDYRNYILENYPNFIDLEKNDFNKHLLEEPTARTRLIELKEYLETISDGYNFYELNSAHLNAYIKYVINQQGVEQIKTLWNDYNLNELELSICTEGFNKVDYVLKEAHQRFLVFNNVSKPVKIEVLDESNEILSNRTLEKKGVQYIHISEKANVFIRLIKDNTCFMVKNPEPFSYFIIE